MLYPILAFCFLAVACGDDKDAASISSDLEGIYKISHATQNSESCDAEGKSIIESISEKYFIFVSYKSYGVDYLTFVSCENPEKCKEIAKTAKSGEMGFGGEFLDNLTSGDDSKGYNSKIITTGYNSDGICTKSGVKEGNLIKIDASTLKWTLKFSAGKDYEAKDDTCSTEAAKEAVKGRPCSEYTVIQGTFVEKLD